MMKLALPNLPVAIPDYLSPSLSTGWSATTLFPSSVAEQSHATGTDSSQGMMKKFSLFSDFAQDQGNPDPKWELAHPLPKPSLRAMNQHLETLVRQFVTTTASRARRRSSGQGLSPNIQPSKRLVRMSVFDC